MRCKPGRKGFTLVELMIVIAIVAILVGLAIPNYSRYVRKANRGEAQRSLLNWANNQEIWRANDADYAGVAELAAPVHERYTFTLPVRTASTYTLRATAIGDQSKDAEGATSCATLDLDQSNGKSPLECWQ